MASLILSICSEVRSRPARQGQTCAEQAVGHTRDERALITEDGLPMHGFPVVVGSRCPSPPVPGTLPRPSSRSRQAERARR